MLFAELAAPANHDLTSWALVAVDWHCAFAFSPSPTSYVGRNLGGLR